MMLKTKQSMESKKLEYFDWKDIQKEICKEMGIEEVHFRDYNKHIGGLYKDLWHEWITTFDPELRNDSVTEVSILDNDIEDYIEDAKEQGRGWTEPFIRSVYAVWEKYKIEYVKYLW